jgi:hypothetical protein
MPFVVPLSCFDHLGLCFGRNIKDVIIGKVHLMKKLTIVRARWVS